MAVAAVADERLAGTLLGTALGDALGLPAEGMSPAAIRRRFDRMDEFHLLGPWGFVSDDTEQSALVAQCLARYGHDEAACVAAFRRALLAWAVRLPFGAGLTTVRACLRIGLALRRSGALHGEAGLPAGLVSRIQDGPFGPTHLRALARWLSAARRGEPADRVGFSALATFARNVALLPVILGHGFRRLLPF